MKWINLESQLILKDEVAAVKPVKSGSRSSVMVTLKSGTQISLMDAEADFVWKMFKNEADVERSGWNQHDSPLA